MDIGAKLRSLRVMNNLTQEELANRSELSKGFISQVESNQTSPSISTLMDILECLGTNLKDFFSETTDEKIVFSPNDFFVQEDSENKNEITWIIPNAQKNEMEPILLTLEKEGKTNISAPYQGEEFGYVLSGKIILHIGKKKYKAKKGDTYYFRPTEEHFIENIGQSSATVLRVATPPNF